MIMVDEIQIWPNAKHRCFKAGSCHLTIVDEPIEHLHDFAARLYMKRSWFQDHKLAPHYDLTSIKREIALRIGAVFVPAREQAKARIAKRQAEKVGP